MVSARLGLIYHDVYNKNKSIKLSSPLPLPQKAIEIDKSNPLFSMHYGHYNELQKNDLAEAYYLKSLSQDPDLIEIILPSEYIQPKTKINDSIIIKKPLNYWSNLKKKTTIIQHLKTNKKLHHFKMHEFFWPKII